MYNKKWIFTYFILVITTFYFGYINTESGSTEGKIYNLLEFEDVLLVFGINTFSIIVLFFLSFFGGSIPFIFKLLYSIGSAAKASGVSPLIYFPISLCHGLFEIIALFIILSIAKESIVLFIDIVKKKKNSKEFKSFMINTLKRELPILVGILIIGALIEVYISNRLFVWVMTS
ncbi:hypothetical protein BAMA_10440 [Bacillus manliponensis]|uniref:Stage II sporulation protein M n=1 Tax=Bacillus manliponensis TaxID=574376 RepID=A0A073JUD1_9BACI|nr:hypothetical protein [Bacillus manliponensis]KEK17895.1 hypothetical protein BAMA_10440 [Bacillus manliponensis]